MTKFEIWRDVVLLAIALFGAGLSLFNYIDARRRDRRSVKVTMSTAIPAFDDGILGATFVRVSVTNTGVRPVNIVSLGLQLRNGSRLGSLATDQMPGINDSRFPITLVDGEQASIFMMYKDIGRAVSGRGIAKVEVIPVAEDSTGKLFQGKSWKIDPTEWSGM